MKRKYHLILVANLVARIDVPEQLNNQTEPRKKSIVKTLWEIRTEWPQSANISSHYKENYRAYCKKVSKTSTCKKHSTVCIGKLGKRSKQSTKTGLYICSGIQLAQPWSRIPNSTMSWGKFGKEGGCTKYSNYA